MKTCGPRAWLPRWSVPGPTIWPPICARSSRATCRSRPPTPTSLWTKIYNLVAGFGRSSILPRNTREHKLHIADTLSYNTGRVQWKFGGDFIQAWIYNYYPSMFGGEYYFDDVKVNPWTYAPMKYGEPLTPLRAYAHEVPRYYMQNFGTAVSHPNSRFYSAFMQDTIRVTRSFTLNVGVRYDLQTFEPGNTGNQSAVSALGKSPTDTHNLSPRVGFSYALGDVSRW